mgnify:CR=1 FL=1|jgi:hypothetical protein
MFDECGPLPESIKKEWDVYAKRCKQEVVIEEAFHLFDYLNRGYEIGCPELKERLRLDYLKDGGMC